MPTMEARDHNSELPETSERVFQERSGGPSQLSSRANTDSSMHWEPRLAGHPDSEAPINAKEDDEAHEQAAALASKAIGVVGSVECSQQRTVTSQSNGLSHALQQHDEGDSESTSPKRQPVKKADRFSIEITKCRAVCPDWQDDTLNPSNFNGRPDTVILGIPYLLLQLPPGRPARHPKYHPVQVSAPYALRPQREPDSRIPRLEVCYLHTFNFLQLPDLTICEISSSFKLLHNTGT